MPTTVSAGVNPKRAIWDRGCSCEVAAVPSADFVVFSSRAGMALHVQAKSVKSVLTSGALSKPLYSRLS